jgi:hypothetical protein
MSLVCLAHRFATVRALRGTTLAATRVIDSSILAVDAVAKDETRPFVVGYTDGLARNQRGLDPARPVTPRRRRFRLAQRDLPPAVGLGTRRSLPLGLDRRDLDLPRHDRRGPFGRERRR